VAESLYDSTQRYLKVKFFVIAIVKKIAKVTELIGPVSSPFASAIPLTNNLRKISGKKVFALDQAPAKKKSRRKYR
jgi:rRNA processing protein Gar1